MRPLSSLVCVFPSVLGCPGSEQTTVSTTKSERGKELKAYVSK